MDYIPDFNYIRGRFFWHFSELYTRYTGYRVVLPFLLYPILLCLYVMLAYNFHGYENSSHFPVVSYVRRLLFKNRSHERMVNNTLLLCS